MPSNQQVYEVISGVDNQRSEGRLFLSTPKGSALKKLSQTIVGLVAATWLSTGMAIPVTANSGVTFYHDMVIASGGQLPVGLESRVGPPDFSFSTGSSLQSPDAVDFDDTDVVIAGVEPAAPSTFTSLSSSTRNAGSEGAFSTNNTQLYQIVTPEIVFDGTNDISERGLWGGGAAQASLSTEVFDTRSDSDVSLERGFTFSNQNPTALTFGIEGRFEMGMFAMADGENSLAEAFANIDMFFSSSNVLDIVFSDTSVYTNSETESGSNAAISIVRETDVVNTGHLSLTGSANASGFSGGGAQQAFGNSAMTYVLGITLQPFEEITMSHLITYSNLAAIEERAVDVSEPSSLLLLSFFVGFLALRQRRRWNHQAT